MTEQIKSNVHRRVMVKTCKDEFDVENFYNYYFERQSKYKVIKWDTFLLYSSSLLAQIEVEFLE